MKTKIIAVIICIIGFMQNGLSQTNLLVNGDFEKSPTNGSKVANGWLAEWWPTAAGAITTSTSARSGRCGSYFYTDIGKSETYIYQTVNCLSNKNYKAAAFFRCPKAQKGTWTKGTEAYLMVEFQNNTGTIINEPQFSGKMLLLNPEWQEYSLQIKTPEKAAKIIFTVKLTSENGQSILNVDDCSLVQIN